jgi:hypothetical protein
VLGYPFSILTVEAMSSPIPLPDPMPLRDALRGLRHAVRRGGETFLDSMPVESLPPPAAKLAEVVLREVGEIARSMNDAASGLARVALGAGDKPHGTLQDLAARADAEDAFARGIYAALREVLRRLHAPSAYISETAARSAYLALPAERKTGSTARKAATLSLSLYDGKVIRGASAEEASRVPGAALESVGIFAVMLWLQSDRNENENEEALDAATDLAVALAAEAAAAFRDHDEKRLETLYLEFSGHV